MTIAFNCSECEAPLKVADNLAGKKCKCPKCGFVNPVPGDEEDAAESVPPKKAGSGVRKKPDADEDAVEDFGEVKGKKARAKKAGAKKRGGGSKWLLIGGGLLLLGGGLFMCLCGGGGFAVWMWLPEYVPAFLGGWPGEMRYLPTGTSTLSYHRVDQERGSKYWKDVDAATPQKVKDLQKNVKLHGIDIAKVDCILTGSSGSNSVTVVTTKAPVTVADMKAETKGEFEEVKAGKYTINKPKSGGQSFCIVDSKTVVLSGDSSTLEAVLKRDKMPEFSTAMQAALKKASFSHTKTSILTGTGTELGGPGKARKNAEWVIFQEDLGSDKRTKIVAEFKDKESAADAKKEADDTLLKEKGELEKLGVAGEVQMTVSVSGTTVTGERRETAKVTIEQLKKFFPN
jgi:hypothetical protein